MVSFMFLCLFSMFLLSFILWFLWFLSASLWDCWICACYWLCTLSYQAWFCIRALWCWRLCLTYWNCRIAATTFEIRCQDKENEELHSEISNIANTTISTQITLESNPQSLRNKSRPYSFTREQQQRRSIHKSNKTNSNFFITVKAIITRSITSFVEETVNKFSIYE